MRSLLSLTAASLLLLASRGFASDLTLENVEAVIASPQGQAASRLVRLLRSDEIAQGVALKLSRTLHAKGSIDDKQLACLEGLKIEEFNHAYAIVVVEHYEVPVVDRAIEFYSSPVGSRFMRMVYERSWRMNPTEFPLRPDRPKEGLTMQQWQEVIEFVQSPLSAPLADPHALTQLPESLKGNALLWSVKAMQCGVPEKVVRDSAP